MRVVIALGGNALLRRGEPMDAETQRRNVLVAAEAVAAVARDHQVVVTHGNGPQVGLLALESAAYAPVPPYPLDVLGAESQGMIGYFLESALRNALRGTEVVSILTQVEVDRADPAFRAPRKPIGPIYPAPDAASLATGRGWAFAPDGDGFRRVVASPEPLRVVEIAAIRFLVERGVLVVAAGGGGVPVAVDATGAEHGVEAVVDKDLTAALLARQLEAEALLLLTDVPGVFTDWGLATARLLRAATPIGLRGFTFAAGSMGPKVEAACRFVEATGGIAAIGALAEATDILRGEAGTTVRSAGEPLSYWS